VVNTLAPTPAPTDEPTTPSPTGENPTMWLDARTTGCTGLGVGIPSCVTQESDTVPFKLYLGHDPVDFERNITYKWQIHYTDPTLPTDTDTTRRRLVAGANSLDIDGDDQGNSTLTGYWYDTSADRFHEIIFRVEANTTENDENDYVNAGEDFWFELQQCWGPPLGAGHAGSYDCQVVDSPADDQYYLVKISLVDSTTDTRITQTTGDIPWWTWVVVAASLVLLPLLGWWGYRQIQKRKYAEEMQEMKKKELKDAENMDDFGNFGGVGDEVMFNPLATGGAADIATGGDYVDAQMSDARAANTQNATVDVNKEVFKQSFGPVQAQRH